MLIEAILTGVIILLMLIFVGVPIVSIIEWTLIILSGLMALTILFFILFFLITAISLPFYRRVQGQFSHFDDSAKWERAVYLAEGKEYICRFPAESVFRRKIYKEADSERSCLLLIARGGKNKAYDRHSLMIIAVGTSVSIILITTIAIGLMYFIQISGLY